MSLNKELKGQTVVILAQTFNPSVFNQHWLVKNEFAKDEDLINSIFTPGIAQVITPEYTLVVLPQQLQFIQNNLEISFENSIRNILLPIIRKLQEVPYTAVGINFNWHVDDTNDTINKLSKKLFFIEGSNLYNSFNDDNAKFGSYMSIDFLDSRLKLDIKPLNLKDNNAIIKEIIQFSFNFHIDLNLDNSAEQLINGLNSYVNYFNESDRIIKSL